MWNRTLGAALLLVAIAPVAHGQGRERGRFSFTGDEATCMALDAKNKLALIGFGSGSVCVFPADQKIVHVIGFPAHKKAVTAAAFFPDSKSFVTVSADGALKVWDVAAARRHHRELEEKKDARPPMPKPTVAATAHGNALCLAMRPDGKQLATGGADGLLRLWDPETGKSAGQVRDAHGGGVRAVAYAPDGKHLVSGGGDKTARVWDLTEERPKLAHRLTGHAGAVLAVAYRPDGKHIATASGLPKTSGSIKFWDPATGKADFELTGPTDVVTSIVFDPKAPRMASAGADKQIRVWDLIAKEVKYADEHADPIRALILAADGSQMGSVSGRNVLWWVGIRGK